MVINTTDATSRKEFLILLKPLGSFPVFNEIRDNQPVVFNEIRDNQPVVFNEIRDNQPVVLMVFVMISL